MISPPPLSPPIHHIVYNLTARPLATTLNLFLAQTNQPRETITLLLLHRRNRHESLAGRISRARWARHQHVVGKSQLKQVYNLAGREDDEEEEEEEQCK